MKRFASLMLSFVLVFGICAIPSETYAATKAPGKVAAKTIKMTVVNGNSLKFTWGTAKTGKKVNKKTGYQVQYKVEVLQDNGKYKVTTNWKSLKKGTKRYHVYKGAKGNKYRVSLRVRAYNGKKFGPWSSTQAKAKKIVKLIPAFAPKYATFSPTLSQFGDNRSITGPANYYNTQGCVFDTYTGRDGYNFILDSDGGDLAKVTHFTIDGEDIAQEGYVLYKTSQIGHANDGTMYQRGGDNGRKYMFVAISGGSDVKSSEGIQIGYIDMDEFAALSAAGSSAQGVVHKVTIKANSGVKMSSAVDSCKFSGITYTGNRGGSDVFVLKDGRTFYAAKLTFDGNDNPILTIFDSARIVKPTFSIDGATKDGITQGITYHNGFIYVTYSSESYSDKCRTKIGRITYAHLFSDTYADLRTLQQVERKITQGNGQTLAKNIPEALFFTTLEGADNLYISYNRGTNAASGSDCDCLYRSSEQY